VEDKTRANEQLTDELAQKTVGAFVSRGWDFLGCLSCTYADVDRLYRKELAECLFDVRLRCVL
jgi:hypothetical protein